MYGVDIYAEREYLIRCEEGNLVFVKSPEGFVPFFSYMGYEPVCSSENFPCFSELCGEEGPISSLICCRDEVSYLGRWEWRLLSCPLLVKKKHHHRQAFGGQSGGQAIFVIGGLRAKLSLVAQVAPFS